MAEYGPQIQQMKLWIRKYRVGESDALSVLYTPEESPGDGWQVVPLTATNVVVQCLSRLMLVASLAGEATEGCQVDIDGLPVGTAERE